MTPAAIADDLDAAIRAGLALFEGAADEGTVKRLPPRRLVCAGDSRPPCDQMHPFLTA